MVVTRSEPFAERDATRPASGQRKAGVREHVEQILVHALGQIAGR
jgi:hypothetical protein